MVAVPVTTGTAVTWAVMVAVPAVAEAVKVAVATPLPLVVALVDDRLPREVARVIPRPAWAEPLFVTVTVTVVVERPSAGILARPATTWMARPEEMSVQAPAWQRITAEVPHCWPSQEVSAQSTLPLQSLSTPSLQLASVVAPAGLGAQAGGVQTEGAELEQVPAPPPVVVQAAPVEAQLGSELQFVAQAAPPPPPPPGVLKLALLPQARRAPETQSAAARMPRRVFIMCGAPFPLALFRLPPTVSRPTSESRKMPATERTGK
jgi:hypothetical protein